MNNIETIKWLDCKTPEEVLYNVFTLKPEAKHIFMNVVNIFLEQNKKILTIKNDEWLKNILIELINDEVKRHKFFEFIEEIKWDIKWWEILSEAVLLFVQILKDNSSKELEFDLVKKHVQSKLINKIMDIVDWISWWECEVESIFENIDWVEIKSNYKYNDVKNILLSFDTNTLFKIYNEFLKLENFKVHNKNRLSQYISDNCNLTKEKFEEIWLDTFALKGCDWAIVQAIKKWFIVKQFDISLLNLLVQNWCNKSIITASELWFLNDSDKLKIQVKEIWLKTLVDKWSDYLISLVIKNWWITYEDYLKVWFQKLVENWCDLTINCILDTYKWIDLSELYNIWIQNLVENWFDKTLANIIWSVDKFNEVWLIVYIENWCDDTLISAIKEWWVIKEDIERIWLWIFVENWCINSMVFLLANDIISEDYVKKQLKQIWYNKLYENWCKWSLLSMSWWE